MKRAVTRCYDASSSFHSTENQRPGDLIRSSSRCSMSTPTSVYSDSDSSSASSLASSSNSRNQTSKPTAYAPSVSNTNACRRISNNNAGTHKIDDSHSGSISENLSQVDCQTIGNSMKRVKISTSPGELRLNKDFDSMLSTKHWTHYTNDSRTDSTATIQSLHRQNYLQYHTMLVSPDGQALLERDAANPLRLSLTVLFQTKKWIFRIEIPRIYPHSPPIIYRLTQITLETNVPNANQSFGAHNVREISSVTFDHSTSDNDGGDDADYHWMPTGSPSIHGHINKYPLENSSPSSLGHYDQVMLQRIEVTSSPPNHIAHHFESDNATLGNAAIKKASQYRPQGVNFEQNHKNDINFVYKRVGKHTNSLNSNKHYYFACVAIYAHWSPVSCLVDLIDSLISLPHRWSQEMEEQHIMGRFSNSSSPSVQHPEFDINLNGNRSLQSQTQCDNGEDDDDIMSVEEDAKESQSAIVAAAAAYSDTASKHRFPFQPNRFDVGYTRDVVASSRPGGNHSWTKFPSSSRHLCSDMTDSNQMVDSERGSNVLTTNHGRNNVDRITTPSLCTLLSIPGSSLDTTKMGRGQHVDMMME